MTVRCRNCGAELKAPHGVLKHWELCRMFEWSNLGDGEGICPECAEARKNDKERKK